VTAYYVRSGAGGAGTGADWANAYTTLTLAFSGKAAGDVFYVSEDHNESTASTVTPTSPGTAASPCFIYCVNHSGSVPPVSADLRTTANVKTTANNTISFGAQAAYYYGIIFTAGNSSGSPVLNTAIASATSLRFDSCGFTIGSTGASAKIQFANAAINGGTQDFINCTFTFASATGQGFTTVSTAHDINVRIIGGSVVVGANVPTTLFAALPSNLLPRS
jgi:hypothetical protein